RALAQPARRRVERQRLVERAALAPAHAFVVERLGEREAGRARAVEVGPKDRPRLLVAAQRLLVATELAERHRQRLTGPGDVERVGPEHPLEHRERLAKASARGLVPAFVVIDQRGL